MHHLSEFQGLCLNISRSYLSLSLFLQSSIVEHHKSNQYLDHWHFVDLQKESRSCILLIFVYLCFQIAFEAGYMYWCRNTVKSTSCPLFERCRGVLVERSPSMREIGVLLKQVVTTPLSNARQQVLVSRFLGDDHYKELTRVTVGVERLRNQNCSPSSVMVTPPNEWKKYELDEKKPTNKTNLLASLTYENEQFYLLCILALKCGRSISGK